MYIFLYESTIDKTVNVGTMTSIPSHLNGFPITEAMKDEIEKNGAFFSESDPTIKFKFCFMKEGVWPMPEDE